MATNEYQLSDGRPEGAVLGQSSSDLIAFHGAEPCDQSPTAASVTTTASTTTTPAGYATTTQADAVITAVNAILVCLKEKGLMASA
jgi:hypothetical protein